MIARADYSTCLGMLEHSIQQSSITPLHCYLRSIPRTTFKSG